MSKAMWSLGLAAMATVAMGAPAGAEAADGARDLNGVWTNASATRLERTANFDKLVVPMEEAEAMKAAAIARSAAANAPSDPNAGAFQDANSVAGYNSFWTNPGIGLAIVRGEARSSYITSTADGRIPFIDRAKSLAEPMREGREYRTGGGAYPGPEDLPLRERCLIAQSDGGGPVMLDGLYNNNNEFHLTDTHFVINVEMVHDARIIPIYGSASAARAAHKPAAIMPWLGDTVAWWEGDTLVAETVNVHPVQAVRTSTPLTPDGVVTERFTRLADDELLYQFEVEDPNHYTEKWSGEYTFRPTEGRVHEYACHEGNYSMDGILAGARLKERAG